MIDHKKNGLLLRPFFGIPSHNNKAIQLLYAVSSIALIAHVINRMPESYKIKQWFNPVFTSIKSAPKWLQNTINYALLASSITLSFLFFVSLFRTIFSKQNFNDKLNNTSHYSQINDIVYWLGAGVILSSLIIPCFKLIYGITIPEINIAGEALSIDNLLLFIGAGFILTGLTMSLISTMVPSLTLPKSYVDQAATIQKEEHREVT